MFLTNHPCINCRIIKTAKDRDQERELCTACIKGMAEQADKTEKMFKAISKVVTKLAKEANKKLDEYVFKMILDDDKGEE